MITLAEPQQRVVKLWGRQAAKPGETYRLMKYVLRVEHEGHTALHNVMTGQLILLNDDEIRLVDSLPAAYSADMEVLVADHYLVPEGYDEYKQLVSLRTILRKLTPPVKNITHYTILPTTACNARCYYCFEQGSKIVTMTEQTAQDTVRFIAEHCGEEKKVSITWFGGEPTVAANRIDQICHGLQRAGIAYTGMMYTNGYLFDEEMADKARDLWHVNHMQIVIDGTEELYNRIKNYVNPQDNPYQRVMRNIGLLLDRGIRVAVRMNIDRINHNSFESVANELINRYPSRKNLVMWAKPVIGDYSEGDPEKEHADDEWLDNRVAALNDSAKSFGLSTHVDTLPSLQEWGCMADGDKSLVICASGALAKCPEQFDEGDEVGNLREGLINNGLIVAWHKILYEDICTNCAYAPQCVRIAKCAGTGAGRCGRERQNKKFMHAIQKTIAASIMRRSENDGF